MKYIYLTPEAINHLIVSRQYQSCEYTECKPLIELLQNKSSSFDDKTVHSMVIKNGVVLYAGMLTKKEGLFFDYDQFTTFLTDSPGRIITIFQKILRFAVRYFNGRGFAQCEMLRDNKGIIFPFPLTDRGESYRVVVDRNSFRDGKTFNFLTVYYGGVNEINSSPNFSNLSQFYDEFKSSSTPANNVDAHIENSDVCGLTVLELDNIDYHIHSGLSYEEWRSYLTEPQRLFVERDVRGAERLEGAAGTGKTLAMVIKCIRQIKNNPDKKYIFITHSIATKMHIIDLFIQCAPELNEYMCIEGSLSGNLLVTTVQEWCIKYLGTNLSETEYLDRDALTSKNLQKMYIEEAYNKVVSENLSFYRNILSNKYLEFIENSDKEILLDMLQYEIGVVIKGRANGELDKYKALSRPSYGIPCKNDADFNFTHLIYSDYQKQLCQESTFDSDDIVITALSSLNAPIWRRRRETEGFDACFIDETHLFNFNELSVFPFLNRTKAKHNIIFAIDKSQFGGEILDKAEDIFSMSQDSDITPIDTRFNTVFRSSADILNLAFNVMSVGSTLYTNFDNPLETSYYLTNDSSQRFVFPNLQMLTSEDEMVSKAIDIIDEIHRKFSISRAECVIIAMSDILVKKICALFEKSHKPFESIESRGDVAAKERAMQSNKYVVAGVDYVGGLEFDYAIFVGVDESRVPPRLSQKKSDFYFSNYAWHKKIYVALTRARYGVYLLGESSQGISPILETAISENLIEVKK